MRRLKNWIDTYVNRHAYHLEAPKHMHTWAAIGTIAGALGGRVWLDMGHFRWKPNFFILFVAPPGVVSKSTTAGVGTALLREIHGVHFGPDSTTWQALLEAFIESERAVPGIGMISPLHIVASELGTFFDPRNRELTDNMCELWDGKPRPLIRKTKKDGEKLIQNPFFNFMACTTPGWLQEHFPQVAIHGGFTSRTIFVYADAKEVLVPYPFMSIAQQGPDFEQARQDLIHDLNLISLMSGPFELTEDGKAWGLGWYNEFWTNRPKHLDPEIFGGYISRKQTHIHKTAMVLSAAESDSRKLEPRHLQRALELLDFLEPAMVEVFRSLGQPPEARYAITIARYLRTAGGQMGHGALWRKLVFSMSRENYDMALSGLIQSGLVENAGSALRLSAAYSDDKVIEGSWSPRRSRTAPQSEPEPQPQTAPSVPQQDPVSTFLAQRHGQAPAVVAASPSETVEANPSQSAPADQVRFG